MLNIENLSALLRWAQDNIHTPIQEIIALDGAVQVRLADGRTGFLYTGANGPCVLLPA